MPLPSHPEPRKSLRHSVWWAIAFTLLVIALTIWPKHHTVASVLLAAAVTAMLVGRRRVQRANREIDEAAAATAPPAGSDSRPIEPAGGVSPGKLVALPILLVALVMEFHPLAEAVLVNTSYRLLRAADDAAPPLEPGDQVWIRMSRSRPRAGEVVGLWDDRHRWRLATVVAAPGDTVSAARPYDWVERDESGEIVEAADDVRMPRVVPPDSIAVSIHARAAAPRPEAEVLPAGDAEAIALRVLFPRWRRLP